MKEHIQIVRLKLAFLASVGRLGRPAIPVLKRRPDRRPRGITESVRKSERSPGRLHYEIGPIRPPSEAFSGSLSDLPGTAPGTKCEFCHLYKGKKFERRTAEEIKRDIDTIRRMWDAVETLTKQRGEAPEVSRQPAERAVGAPMQRCLQVAWLLK